MPLPVEVKVTLVGLKKALMNIILISISVIVYDIHHYQHHQHHHHQRYQNNDNHQQ